MRRSGTIDLTCTYVENTTTTDGSADGHVVDGIEFRMAALCSLVRICLQSLYDMLKRRSTETETQ